MDITRNWRLKTARSQLIATRDIRTGVVMLQQTSLSAVKPADEIYVFERINPRTSPEGRNGNGHKTEEAPLGEGFSTVAEAIPVVSKERGR